MIYGFNKMKKELSKKKNIINGSLKKINERIFKITKYKID
jgi:hypothetical protein